jgi:hypothetical protein
MRLSIQQRTAISATMLTALAKRSFVLILETKGHKLKTWQSRKHLSNVDLSKLALLNDGSVSPGMEITGKIVRGERENPQAGQSCNPCPLKNKPEESF